MRMEPTSPQLWRQVLKQIKTNTATFQGRKVLYIKPGEIEWFDDKAEASQKGFHPARLTEIHELATKQLQEKELEELDSEFSSLIEVCKAKKLLANSECSPEKLRQHGILMVEKGQKTENLTCIELGQRCLETATSKFIQEGNVSKANDSKRALVQHVRFDKKHPLSKIKAVADVERTQGSIEKGIFVSNLDGGNLKNGVVKASSRLIDQQVVSQLSFKISYPARGELETHLQFVQDNLEEFISTVCEGLCSDVVISRRPEVYLPFQEGGFRSESALEIDDGEIIEVDFVGLGKIRIGNNPKVGCSYNRVELEFSAELLSEKMLTSAQKMFNAIGLKVDLHESQTSDIERRKIMAIFHNYLPSLAFEFENRNDVYTLDPNNLREEICAIEPWMHEMFDFYGQNPDWISEEEIYPGKKRLLFLDIPMKVREAGGVGLMIGVPHGNVPKRVAAILTTGPLSTQDRYEAGLLVAGTSSSFDYSSGGGDSVFTRMITETSIEDEVSISTYPLSGSVQILVDLEVLARGGYAFTEDAYGQKNRFDEHELYAERQTLWDCTTEVNDSSKNLYRNEFMIKNHIQPSHIRGIVVPDAGMKREVIEALRTEGLIITEVGQETIHGIPVDEFIQVASFFEKEMWGT